MLHSNEFKVFDLLPLDNNSGSDPVIRGKTRVVPLPTEESYETLSYVWGHSPPQVQIEVDGREVAITHTLAAALSRLRLHDRSRTLWVDQLCITQDDDTEKATQVPLMGQIYTNTSRCLIWMGDVRPDIALEDAVSAFELLTYIHDEADETASKNLTIPRCLTSAETIVGPMEALRSIGLNQNPWWERIWTLQEVVLPSEALMVWGPLSISWAVLAVVSRACTRGISPLVGRMIWPHVSALNSLITQVNGLEFAREKTQGPLHIAFRWGFRKATNPLDKVYGFLGLFPTGSLKRAGRPDYDLSAATVYAMFTVDMIECEKDLHPIALWNAYQSRMCTPNIPSWAFDMSNPVREFADVAVRMAAVFPPNDDNIVWYLLDTYRAYNASGGSPIDWNEFSFDAGLGHLKLTGQLVDAIRIVGAPLESNDPETKAVSDREVIERIQDWRQRVEHVHRDRQSPDGSQGVVSWPDSFWRGLIGNIVGRNQWPERRANAEDVAAVQRFVETGERAHVCQQIFATMTYRTVALTESGLLSFCPRHSLVGDQVWLLHGGRVPFVVRPEGTGGFRLIGPAYVDGIMDGEAIHDGSKNSITLV